MVMVMNFFDAAKIIGRLEFDDLRNNNQLSLEVQRLHIHICSLVLQLHTTGSCIQASTAISFIHAAPTTSTYDKIPESTHKRIATSLKRTPLGKKRKRVNRRDDWQSVLEICQSRAQTYTALEPRHFDRSCDNEYTKLDHFGLDLRTSQANTDQLLQSRDKMHKFWSYTKWADNRIKNYNDGNMTERRDQLAAEIGIDRADLLLYLKVRQQLEEGVDRLGHQGFLDLFSDTWVLFTRLNSDSRVALFEACEKDKTIRLASELLSQSHMKSVSAYDKLIDQALTSEAVQCPDILESDCSTNSIQKAGCHNDSTTTAWPGTTIGSEDWMDINNIPMAGYTWPGTTIGSEDWMDINNIPMAGHTWPGTTIGSEDWMDINNIPMAGYTWPGTTIGSEDWMDIKNIQRAGYHNDSTTAVAEDVFTNDFSIWPSIAVGGDCDI